MPTDDSDYQLGHAATELERLDVQGGLLAPATSALLSAAGLAPGMDVLDLGCGAGDMAFVAAALIGHDGSVLGIDRSADAVESAIARAADRGLGNARFVVGDMSDPAPGGPFDAIVGRLVLMYAGDPAAVIRAQLPELCRGGIVAPIEFDVTTARSVPSVDLVEQAVGWVRAAFDRAGISASLGPRLWSVLVDAGVQPLGMLGVQPLFGPDDAGGPALLAGIVRTLLPLMERLGVATAQQVEPATLAARLGEALKAAEAVFAHPTLFCAWGTER